MSSFIEQQNNLSTEELVSDHYDSSKSSIRIEFSRYIRSKLFKGLLFIFFFALSVPILIFFFVVHLQYSVVEETNTCLVDYGYRVPCGKINITHDSCTAIFCCYDVDTSECYHYLPSLYTYYESNVNEVRTIYFPTQRVTTLGNASKEQLSVSVAENNENKVQIVLHEAGETYEETVTENKNYNVTLFQENLYVEVYRASTGDRLFTSSKGPLIASDGYWEWTFHLTTEKMFGLGEITFGENTTYTKVIYKNKNDHNTLPIFMAYQNGSFHGAVVHHDGPLEVTVLPSFMVILRWLVGDYLSITLCTGPRPVDVVQQLQERAPEVPPYWVLGAHICRRGSTSIDSLLQEYEEFLSNENNAVNYASDCLHENLLYLLNEANEEEMVRVEYAIGTLHNNSRFLASVSPQILISENDLYNTAVELDILHKNGNGEILNGTYNGRQAAYPDYSHPLIETFFQNFLDGLITDQYDGFVLVDNWPAEEVYQMNENDTFPYISNDIREAMSGTLPWNVTTSDNSTHIFKHNSYGAAQMQLFQNYTSAFLMSASYDYGMSQAALVQTMNVSWTNFHQAIRKSLYHSLLGGPLISIPVCGSMSDYNSTTHEALCMRWYIMAATMPIFRISSDFPRRDPASLGTGHAYRIALDAIKKRNQLAVYYHTVMSSGEPLVRPMFYDFYADNETLELDQQYMVGTALLVAQPVLPDVSSVRIYLPPEVGVWYEFWGGKKHTELGWMQMSIVETDWIMFVAGGHIVPLRNDEGDGTSLDTLSLAVALNCSGNSSSCSSTGTLYVGSMTITFQANETGVTVGNLTDVVYTAVCEVNRDWPTVIENVKVYGLEDYLVTSNSSRVDLCGDEMGSVEEYFINYFQS